MALKLDILANTRQFVGDMKKAGASVEDISDSLNDMQQDGEKAGQKLEQSFRDVVREAKKADTAVEKVGDGGKKGFGKASDASHEFKSEALANLSEVTSSFDGSFSSIGDLVQGTLGGLTASLPGVLGIAGAAGAAAIGLTTAAFQNAQAAADEAKESAYEYGITVAESGKYADVAARINDLTGSVEGLKKVQDIATISGRSQVDVVKALATGDGLPALIKAYEKGANATTIASNRSLELESTLTGAAQGFDLATDAADLNARSLYELAKSAGKTTGKVDDLGNAIVEMPDGKEVVINAHTKKAYEDINTFAQKKVPPKDAVVNVHVNDSAWRNWTPVQKAGTVVVGWTGGRTWQ